MSASYGRVIESLRGRGLNVVDRDGRAMAQCPAHDDGRPSLSIKEIEGSVLIWCMAGCQTMDVLACLDLSPSDLFDSPDGFTYEYPGGRRVHRTPDKKFIQSGNTSDNSLYGMDRISDVGDVYVVEGEKDVLAIESIGGQAVSAPNGASANPARYDWTKLSGRTVYVVADADEAGSRRACAVLSHLEGLAGSVLIVDPAVGKDSADHVAAGKGLQDFLVRSPDDVISLSEAFDSWLTWRDSEEREPIATPWSSLNRCLSGGLHPGRLYVIAARTGQGKSVIGQNISTYAAMHHHKTFVVSVEMPVEEIVSRIISAEAEIDYGVLTRRDFGDQHTRIDEYIQRHRCLPMYLCTRPTVTIEEIAAKCRAMKPAGLRLLFCDYAQLIKASDSRVSREQQVAHIARSIKLLALELDISVVLAAQLNRCADQDGRQPRISDLRESGELEQSADVILLLHQEENSPSTIVNVAKNRTGPPKSFSLIRRFDQARLDSV